ncbi:hypothetical protein BDQ17DRAFT_1337762 [Cyathus striatus]|nr:hypothetical protein BDQ17DRAFT_1337762 [Cyathus striatus]
MDAAEAVGAVTDSRGNGTELGAADAFLRLLDLASNVVVGVAELIAADSLVNAMELGIADISVTTDELGSPIALVTTGTSVSLMASTEDVPLVTAVGIGIVVTLLTPVATGTAAGGLPLAQSMVTVTIECSEPSPAICPDTLCIECVPEGIGTAAVNGSPEGLAENSMALPVAIGE